MHIWVPPSSLRYEVHPVYPTTNCPCPSHWRFDDPQSQQGAQVQNQGGPEMGHVPKRTAYIWKYPFGWMFWRHVSHFQSNYHCRAQNRVQRGAFVWHLLIGMIQFWSCLVHTWDVDHSRFCLLAKQLSGPKVICGPKSMRWIPLFWVLVTLLVQSSCFAIRFPLCIFYSNYLPMSLCPGWIRGTGKIRLLRAYRFFVESIIRWWCTWYVVYE